MTGFIAWLGIAISHYRFRKGYQAQGRDLADLPYVSGFFPYGPIFAFVLCLLITLGQYYQQALTGQFSWGSFIATYLGLLVIFSVWLGYRLVKKSRWVRYQDMQFPTQQNSL